MIKRTYPILLTVLLIISTMMAVIGVLSRPSKSRAVYNLANVPSNPEQNLKAGMWENYVSLILPNDGLQLNHFKILKDTAGKEASLKRISAGKYKLVLRYSFADCEVCVDTVISKIRLLEKQFDTKDFLAITSEYSDREFSIKAESKNYMLPIFNLEEKDLGLSLENKQLPFLFVLTPELRVIKIFIPLREFPQQIEEYLVQGFTFVNTSNNNL